MSALRLVPETVFLEVAAVIEKAQDLGRLPANQKLQNGPRFLFCGKMGQPFIRRRHPSPSQDLDGWGDLGVGSIEVDE